MDNRHDSLRDELVALAAEDLRVREELAADGSLFQAGYHPRMEAIHRRNAARLRALIAEYGWLGASLVGEQAAEAAWLIVQHSIGEPEFMRSVLVLLRDATAHGQAPAWQAAMLEDRISMFEGRPQRYGTQLEPDADGNPRPYWTEDPDRLDERRHAVGLEPIAARLARAQRDPMPSGRERFEAEYRAWLRRVGWRA